MWFFTVHIEKKNDISTNKGSSLKQQYVMFPFRSSSATLLFLEHISTYKINVKVDLNFKPHFNAKLGVELQVQLILNLELHMPLSASASLCTPSVQGYKLRFCLHCMYHCEFILKFIKNIIKTITYNTGLKSIEDKTLLRGTRVLSLLNINVLVIVSRAISSRDSLMV